MGYVLFVILLVILALASVVLVRTVSIKPTASAEGLLYSDDERSEKYGEMLARMVGKETISSRYNSDRTKFYEFHEILSELFPNVHSTCQKHVFNGSLLFKWSGKGNNPPILLMSHHDVVEAGGEWKHDPFCGKVIDGAVWGRGTVDTKASLFCLLNAAEELIKEGFVPDCDVYFASSCTEEISGEGAPLTVQYLKEQGVKLGLLIDEGGMIMEEPIGGVRGTYAMIGVLEKGYGDVKFIAKGSGGHASAPGKNTPIVRMADFIHDVEHKNPFTVEFDKTVLEMFRRMTPNMSFALKLIFANLWLFKPLLKKLMPSISPEGAAMLKTTLAFTMAKGSDGLNVLPQEAYVTGNMRFIPHQSTDESIEVISGIAKKYDLEAEVIYKDYPCPVVSYTSDEFKRVEGILKDLFPGVLISPYTMTGGTDAKFYKEVCSNCLRFAPLYINKQQHGSIHGLNENIFARVLPKGVDFYKEVIRRS